MFRWTYLFLVLIGVVCITALPTREEKNKTKEGENPGGADNRLKFEPRTGTDDTQRGNEDVDPKTAELLQQAEANKIGRDAPESHSEIGSPAGEQFVHGEGVHEQQEEKAPIKHVNTGALSDDFVHNMMHDGKEDHAEEDEKIMQGRPADIRDVRKLGLDEDTLKAFREDAFRDPHDDGKEFQDQDHGPGRPDKALHGVLMHGDTEAGTDHTHDDSAKEEKPEANDTVLTQRAAVAGDLPPQEDQPLLAPPNTINVEEIIHGEEGGHVHDSKPEAKVKESGKVDMVLDKDFMHNIMHGGLKHNDHQDADLMKSKVIRPRDLLKLGLDPKLFKGLDLNKMIQDDMEEYNRFMSEQGGDETSIWNILNTFKFRYFKNGEDIDDISMRKPVKEEYDQKVLQIHRAMMENSDKVKSVKEGDLNKERLGHKP